LIGNGGHLVVVDTTSQLIKEMVKNAVFMLKLSIFLFFMQYFYHRSQHFWMFIPTGQEILSA